MKSRAASAPSPNCATSIALLNARRLAAAVPIAAAAVGYLLVLDVANRNTTRPPFWGAAELQAQFMGLGIGEEHVFLGREMGAPREYSEKLAEMIDSEIQSQLLAFEAFTVSFLTEHRQELDALARAVMKRETLSAGEITEVLEEARSRETA